MNLRCVQCQGPLLGSEVHCPQCGRRVDADGNGLPDDLDARVQAAARVAVAEARFEDLTRLADGARKKELAVAEQRLRANRETPRGWVALALRRGWYTFLGVTALLLCGVVFPLQIGLGALDFSPTGSVVCPVYCEGCAGPGRSFHWRYRGSWRANKGSMGAALVCHNPTLDLERARWSDVSNNDALQPYVVHGAVWYFADCILLGAAAAALRMLFGVGRARRRLDEEHAALEAEVTRLRTAG
jgi:hypothetical protein